DYEGDEEEGEESEDNRVREETLAKERELREREKEKEERDRRRAEAVAAAARLPPPNDFVEELASIAWLPVHVTPPDDLLPWKGPSSRGGGARVAAPCNTRPESDKWYCSLSLGVLEGDVKSRSLKRAFGWDRPVTGLRLAQQLVSLSKM
ncbi:unnamed protein product, partial [Laminaria digitata]